jgi:hypothetical protein
MICLGQTTPIAKLICDAVYLASQCVRYQGPLSAAEILSRPGMQAAMRKALADTRGYVPRCRCPPPLETCSCEYYRPEETLRVRWAKVQRQIEWTLAFRKELLRLEGARRRPVVPRTDEEEDAMMLADSSLGEVPEGELEDLMMVNLRKPLDS